MNFIPNQAATNLSLVHLRQLDVDQSLTLATWLCTAAIGLAACTAAIHANGWALSAVPFVVAQALSVTAIANLLIGYWSRALSTSSTVTRFFLLALLAAWIAVATVMTSTAFGLHDEIYSWNLWAIEHWQRKPYDLYYTQASYPQLFSYWLSSIYGAQGGFINQTTARFASSLPSLLLITCAVALWRSNLTKRHALAAGALSVWMVLRTWPDLRLGYADPLMSAQLAVSLLCVLLYLSNKRLQWWIMAVAAATLAGLTKQPAVLWACGGLPLLALIGCWRRRWPLSSVVIACVGAVIVAFYTFFVMSDITNNGGVFARALGERGVLGTLIHSANRYLVRRPDILFVLLLSWWLARRDFMLHILWWLALAPMIGLWFTLGSYEMRQGLHVIWWAGLLALAGLNIRWDVDTPIRKCRSHAQHWRPLISSIATVLILAAVIPGWAARSGFQFKDGQQMAFIQQMGGRQNASTVFEQIVTGQKRVFTTSNYSWGLFYGRTPVFRAGHNGDAATVTSLRDLLLSQHADYAISSGDYAYGPYSVLLLKLAHDCPLALPLEIQSRDDRYQVFRIDQPQLKDCLIRDGS